MNFTEYCIATRNFSALEAIEGYTKSFGFIGRTYRKFRNKFDNFISKKKNISRSEINGLRKRSGMSSLGLLFMKKRGENNKGRITDALNSIKYSAEWLKKNRNAVNNNPMVDADQAIKSYNSHARFNATLARLLGDKRKDKYIDYLYEKGHKYGLPMKIFNDEIASRKAPDGATLTKKLKEELDKMNAESEKVNDKDESK